MNLLRSVNSICDHSDYIMVYGYSHCKYAGLKNSLSILQKKVSAWQLDKHTSERNFNNGQNTELLESKRDDVKSRWKTDMTNIVAENFKRSKEKGQKFISIIFCVDIDHNPYTYSYESVALSSRITDSELRRAYKLCHEFEDKELKAIAQRTFKFVKVKMEGLNIIDVEPINAPWVHQNWAASWKKRKEQKKTGWWDSILTRFSNPTITESQKSGWRDQLKEAQAQYRTTLTHV